jgi:hypothetical protein
MELRGVRKGKENDSESIISRYITAMQVDDITMCIHSY